MGTMVEMTSLSWQEGVQVAQWGRLVTDGSRGSPCINMETRTE